MSTARRSLSGVDLAILRELDAGPFEGLHRMAEALQCNDRRYLRNRLRLLQQAGIVTLRYPPVPCRRSKVIIEKVSG